jgi:hypothetical protein
MAGSDERRTRGGGVPRWLPRCADTGPLSGGYGMRQDIPPDLIQDIRRIPNPFTGYPTRW